MNNKYTNLIFHFSYKTNYAQYDSGSKYEEQSYHNIQER